MKLIAGLVVAAAACAASAQTVTYFWTVTTDNGDTDIGPGEDTAYLSLWAHMDPEAVGFAGSIFDVLGVSGWDTGDITRQTNLFGSLDEPWPDEFNNISGIECFQLPPAFNPDFRADNPIEMYRLRWSTDDYTPRVVEVGDANHLNNDVYTDEFGTSVAYEGIPSVARFTVNVPAPGVLALLGLAAVRRGRR